jgi:hypothetical protein
MDDDLELSDAAPPRVSPLLRPPLLSTASRSPGSPDDLETHRLELLPSLGISVFHVSFPSQVSLSMPRANYSDLIYSASLV